MSNNANPPATLQDYLQDLLHSTSTDALRNTACIATFSSSRFGDDIKDSDLASELATNHQTSISNINVTKKLFAGSFPELDMIVQHVRSTYTKHRKMTQPWKKRGGGLLPNAKIAEYLGVMGEASNKLAALQEACRVAIPRAHEMAKIKLGSTYRESDYKDLYTIPDRFSIHFEIEPIPDGSDLNLPQGYERLQLRGLYDGVRARFARAVEVQWNALATTLLEAKAKTTDGVEVKRWHASTLTNITTRAHDLCDFMKSLGCFDDPDHDGYDMYRVVRDIEYTFNAFDIKQVASTEQARRAVHAAATAALNSMDALTPGVNHVAEPVQEQEQEQEQESRDEWDDVPCVDEIAEPASHPLGQLVPEWVNEAVSNASKNLSEIDQALARLTGGPRTATVQAPVPAPEPSDEPPATPVAGIPDVALCASTHSDAEPVEIATVATTAKQGEKQGELTVEDILKSLLS